MNHPSVVARPSGRKLTRQDVASIAREYQSTAETCVSLSQKYGVDPTTIRYRLQRRGVPLKTQSQARRTLPLREDAFSVLTSEALYWIGFLFVEGCIQHDHPKRSPALQLLIGVDDEPHLRSYRAFLGAGHGIYRSDLGLGKGSCTVRVRSQPIVDDLARLGLSGAKLDREPSAEIAASIDFWRGVIDGDGWIAAPGRKPRITLCGGRPLLERFVEFCEDNGIQAGGIYRASDAKDPRFVYVQVNTLNAAALAKLLYGHADRHWSVAAFVRRQCRRSKRRTGAPKPAPASAVLRQPYSRPRRSRTRRWREPSPQTRFRRRR